MRRLLLLAVLLFSPAAYAAATQGGLDTPNGVTSLPFAIEGQQVMSMTITGLGIGVTSPQAALDVNGGIRASNSSTLVEGKTCAPEGMTGYDLHNHGPIYCNSSGVWASISSHAVRIASATQTFYQVGQLYVSCNSSEQMTGGGGNCSGWPRLMSINGPTDTAATSWEVECMNTGGSNITITAYAFCMAK